MGAHADLRRRVDEATAWLAARGFGGAGVGIILGSGLGPLVEVLDLKAEARGSDVPGYPETTVEGHEGLFLRGRLSGRETIMLKGRLHGYEGHELALTTMPVRIMAGLGVRVLIITNGAGGLDPSFREGELMLIEDHINLQGQSPLRGPNVDDWGPRFPDMSEVYDRGLRSSATDVAARQGLTLRRGVYASVPGPQYETPAEVRMLFALGAHAVGMSSVPEAIVARHMGLRVLGLSLITNAAAGLGDKPLAHGDVVAAGHAAGASLSAFVSALVAEIDS